MTAVRKMASLAPRQPSWHRIAAFQTGGQILSCFPALCGALSGLVPGAASHQAQPLRSMAPVRKGLVEASRATVVSGP